MIQRIFAELQAQAIGDIDFRNTTKNGNNTAAGGSIGTSKQILIDGKVFPSHQAAATFYGIDPGVFGLRINRMGWSPEKAAEISRRQLYQRHSVEVRGQVFGSVKKAAEHFGMDYLLVHSRYVTNGWTLEESLDLSPAPDTAKYRGQAVLVQGVEFPSVSAASRHFGVKSPSVRNRMKKKGESAEDLRDADDFYQSFTTATVQGRKFSAKQRQEIDGLLRQRKRMKKRFATV